MLKIELYKSVVEPVVVATETKTCTHYHHSFNRAIERTENKPDDVEILRLFSKVSSFMLVPDSPDTPFKPVMIWGDKRSAIPDDLTNEELTFLETASSQMLDEELLARVSDVLWVRRHGKGSVSFAHIAIRAYLKGAKSLLPSSWHSCYERLERAFRLFLQIGLKDQQVDATEDVPKLLLEYIEQEKKTEPPFLVIRLIRLLHHVNMTLDTHPKLLEEIASVQEGKGKFDTAEKAWELASAIYRRKKSSDDSLRCEINAAETFIKEGEACEKQANPSFMQVSHFYQRGVEAYRQIAGCKERKEVIYKKLIDAQSKINDEMQRYSTEIDISEAAQQAEAAVTGKDAAHALYALSRLFQLLTIKEIEDAVQDKAEAAPLMATLAMDVHDEKGKRIARVDTAEERMYNHMSQFHRHFYTEAIFFPAWQKIRQEHSISLSMWLGLVRSHPLVPPDHAYTFARGLFSGFYGDFGTAAHILIPQIENAIRYILRNFEIETSKPIKDGLQEESGLNQTLYFPELKEILGENLVFELKGLLVEKTGDNLRNRLSHGLMSDNEFFSHLPPYLYWLILYMLYVPLRKHFEAKADPAEKQSEAKPT